MNRHVKNITLCSVFACILSLLAQIAIPLPGLVPLSLQTLGIYLIGLVLTPKQAFLSTVIYLILGSIGIPVFSGFEAGIARLIGPTGGYLFSFPLMAVSISIVTNKKKGLVRKIEALVAGTVLCYTIGTIWFIYITKSTVMAALLWCVVPFIVGDIIKIAVTIGLSQKIYRYIN